MALNKALKLFFFWYKVHDIKISVIAITLPYRHVSDNAMSLCLRLQTLLSVYNGEREIVKKVLFCVTTSLKGISLNRIGAN